jgi:hypothetical protein
MTPKAVHVSGAHARSLVGRADLVRLWIASRESPRAASSGDFEAAAAVLGFRRSQDDPGVSLLQPEPGSRLRKREPDRPFVEPPPPAIAAAPLAPAMFFRVTRREAISETAQSEGPKNPEWLNNARYLSEDGPGEPGARPPRKAPLAPWSRLWPMLRAILGEVSDTREPDVPELVDRLGAGRAVRRVPMLPRRRWHGEVRILVDFAKRTAPFHRDYAWLRGALAQLRGEEGLAVEALESDPGATLKVRRTDVDRAPYEWRPPTATVPLLVLTDLGLYDPTGPAYDGWVAFGRRLRALGRRAAVLCPVPADKIPAQMRGLFRVYSWDRNSPLKVLGGGGAESRRPPVFDESARSAALDVLTLLAPVLVAEPADVRAVRQSLPPGRGTVAIEALLWRNETATILASEGGVGEPARSGADQVLDRIVAADQGLFTNDLATLQVLRRRWAEYPDDSVRTRALDLILKQHAYWPESMRYAEYEDIDRLMGDIGRFAPKTVSDWLSKDRRDAFEEWKRNMVFTLQKRVDAPGLRRWNGQNIRRQDVEDPAAWRRSPERVARWALNQTPGNAPLQLPGGVDAEAVRPFLPPPPTGVTRIALRQSGTRLIAASSPAVGLVRSEAPATPMPVVEHVVTDAMDWRLSVEVVKAGHEMGEGWLVPLTGLAVELPFRLDHEMRMITIETGLERVVLEGVSRADLPWATHLRRDASGLHAFGPEWCGHAIYMLWHATDGPGTGSWVGGSADTTFGVDDFGLFADLHIGEVKQRCRWILPGTFKMGSPETERGRGESETQHDVTLTRGFWLADTPVTVELWNEVMKDDRRRSGGGDRQPVTDVSWHDTQTFMARLEERVPGLGAGLPTEAQWEFACRAGSQSAYAFGDRITPSEANVDFRELRSVQSYRPNAWGLFDMHGSVVEWCNDWYGDYGTGDQIDPEGAAKGSGRVLRGGSWFDGAVLARSARRGAIGPGRRDGDVGFRLAPGRMSGSSAERGNKQGKEPRGTRGSGTAAGGSRRPSKPARKPATKSR